MKGRPVTGMYSKFSALSLANLQQSPCNPRLQGGSWAGLSGRT